ncbi:cyclic nucleotide-binding domain-containing protein [Thalassospira lucentensis]|uniref:cyclic nucleotide-binding domain-containing protein n=1 Tax=Thalassospira lucentensis TaxID=168935 RepID=UPI003D2F1BCD
MTDEIQSSAQALRTHPALKKVPEEVMASIISVAQQADVSAGDFIMREGEPSTDLYFLLSGDAVALRKSHDGTDILLNAIPEGDCVGELAFLDGGMRTSSVRAESACRLIKIPTTELEARDDAASVIGALKAALASVVVTRARQMSDNMLASLRRELEIKTLQNQFGYFLVFTIAIFLISTALFYLVAEEYVKDVYDPGFSWQAILFLAVPCLLVIKVMKIPLADLGIQREGFKRAALQSVAACVAITIPVAIYLLYFKGPSSGAAATHGATVDLIFLLQYFAHTLFQELGSRGLLQGLFQKFLGDTNGHRAILLTSTVFASLHLAFGIDAVMITFVASIVFGYVYQAQKNLIGVTILHYWLGVLAAFVVAF